MSIKYSPKHAVSSHDGGSRTWLRLYKTARWQRMRERQLTEQPLCVFCLQGGDVEPATVCDHRIAHKGDEFLFWDAGNLQSLCKTCHDRTKQRLERGQDIVTFGADGWPV